ncbi:MAG TPA: hypothetical protein VFV38_08440 [Ktedonobacteraceae bacterium]|nr:hypothetical protein [Ktedonobacteraceae bacterium]
MTIIAQPAEQPQQAPRRVRIQARDALFFRAFAQGYAVAQQDCDGQPITDDTIYGYLHRMMTAPELSPCWKAGAITGWFAALYHIPCSFEEPPKRPKIKPVQAARTPRPIHLHYNDPGFLTAYGAGYEAFAAVVGEEPATDDGLYAELVRDFHAAPTLQEARWSAGYIAGFMAALFRVPALVEDRQPARAVARLERRSQ